MEVTITDAEKEELKKRVLANVEARLTEELLQQMRREVTRDLLKNTYATARDLLGKLVIGKVTDEMIQGQIQKVLTEMGSTSYGNRSAFREAIDKAVLRVVDQYAGIVGKEVSSLMYEALRQRLGSSDTEKK